jgi:hypothetical protein
MGAAGLGSIDIMTTIPDPPYGSAKEGPSPRTTPTPMPRFLPPTALVHIFNDQPSSKAGFVQAAIDPWRFGDPRPVLAHRSQGVLVIPDDLLNFRFNVGVRTLFSGATLSIIVRDAQGRALRSFDREYPPTWFEQIDLSSFAQGPVPENGSLVITVWYGSAIVYGATTDNRNNDASAEIVKELLQSNYY